MMIIVYILVVLTIMLCGILFLPLNIYFKYLDTVSLRARWLFFNFDLVKMMKKAKEETPEKKKKAVTKHKKIEKDKEKTEKAGIIETVDLATDILKGMKQPFKKFNKRIKIRGLMLEISVGADDAAKTALQYGLISASVYGLINLADEKFNLKAKQILVYPAFLDEDIKIYVEFKVKINIFSVLGFILSVDSTKSTKLLKLLKLNQ